MAARKLANEVERCFKKVEEGVQAFESIYDKIISSNNPAQKEKQEDLLKKEIKKLQRMRDQIKAWTAMNDIKDKKPLLEKRRLIETQMEKFKAVEKEMKTKAYSKEGLSAAAKLDPKEKEKLEVVSFLQNMTEELEQQVERLEAEAETLQAGIKKSKKDNSKADRIAELERITERHKWHISKLELLQRSLENGAVDTEAVKDLEDSIKYYVENNQEVDFVEDDELYADLNLEEEEDLYNMNNEGDRVSSQDAQSIQDDMPELEPRASSAGASKSKGQEVPQVAGRRPSAQLKSPLPALATLHTQLPSVPSSTPANNMKPAPIPTRAPGEGLKYASAAAAAAASDKNGVGIAPLPPPPGVQQHHPGVVARRPSVSTSPSAVASHPAVSAPSAAQRATVGATSAADSAPSLPTKSPALSHVSVAAPSTTASSIPPTPALEKADKSEESAQRLSSRKGSTADSVAPSTATPPLTNGDSQEDEEEEESVYHLPSSLADLLETFEMTKAGIAAPSTTTSEKMFEHSRFTCPESADAERPKHYKPQNPYPYTPDHYPQEPLPVFDDSRLYSRVDTDALFYAFYYRQGTYQQFLAAKALKGQSWRFHKQYQTWFQRHEEPKTITEDFEQGTYRFFDYESTWMNRRKADFRFAYKFLEDDL